MDKTRGINMNESVLSKKKTRGITMNNSRTLVVLILLSIFVRQFFMDAKIP